MEVSIYRANNNLYIDISGRIILDICDNLKNAVIPLIDKGINQVYVDLAEVDFIDSAGLGILVGMKMTTNKNKARLVLVSPSPGVSDILIISKLHDIFDIITGSEADVLRNSMASQEYMIQNITHSEVDRAKPENQTEEVEASKRKKIKMPSGPGSTPEPAVSEPEEAEEAEAAEVNITSSGKSVQEQVDEHCRKAVELMRQGDYEKSVEKYLQALELNPDYLPAYNNLAIVYEKKPSWRSKAIETWEKVLELSQANGDQKHIDRAQKHLSNLKTHF